jgi:hypothetical protein
MGVCWDKKFINSKGNIPMLLIRVIFGLLTDVVTSTWSDVLEGNCGHKNLSKGGGGLLLNVPSPVSSASSLAAVSNASSGRLISTKHVAFSSQKN